jgi:D-alanyl-D-alanine carboxypeptidase
MHNRVSAWTHNLHSETASPRHRLPCNQLFKVSRVLSLSCLAFFCGCAAGRQTSPFSDATIAQADRQLNDFVNSGKAPGVVISVTTPKGSWSKAYGVSDKVNHTPMSLTQQSRIGSITKTFTTTLVLMLVEEGKLKLDDPVSDYVPSIPNGDHITVRELGDMTSGLNEYLANAKFQKEFFADPQRNWKPEELVQFGYDLKPAFTPPGSSSLYSNTNTVNLGLLVVSIEKPRTFQQVLDQKILSPLGLNHTAFPLDAAFTGPHTQGYTTLAPGQGEVDSTNYSPTQAFSAGQMISTVDDLSRWIRMLGNGSLLPPALQVERLKWKPVGDNNADFHYMFGMEYYATNWYGHNGQIPGFTAFALYNSDLDATIALMINTDKPIGTEAPCNALMRDISKVFFPNNPVTVPAP